MEQNEHGIIVKGRMASFTQPVLTVDEPSSVLGKLLFKSNLLLLHVTLQLLLHFKSNKLLYKLLLYFITSLKLQDL